MPSSTSKKYARPPGDPARQPPAALPALPLAANLRLLCSYYGTVSEVCRRLGINRSQFNRYLQGASRPADHMLMRICAFFGVEPSEVMLPTDHFDRLVAVRRRPSQSRPAYVEPIEALQRQAVAGLQKYLGYYFEYYHSMSRPGRILKGLVHLYVEGNAVYYRRFERFPARRSKRASAQDFKCRYEGIATLLEDRIFMVDIERLTGNEVSETILYPTRRNHVSRLSGLVLGVSSRDDRRIGCTRVLFEWLGARVDLRQALRSCGVFDDATSIVDEDILDAIRNDIRPEDYMLLARPL